MASCTFTISNGSVFGSNTGTPIINPPQSGILGMHATMHPAVDPETGKIVPRPIVLNSDPSFDLYDDTNVKEEKGSETLWDAAKR